MTTLEEFKSLRAGVAPELQTELVGLMSSDPEAGKQRMVEKDRIAAWHLGVSL